MKDPYKTLGISKSSSEDEIKKAYRQLAIKYHPDKNPGDKVSEEKFKEIAEAYEILSNKEKKAKHDTVGDQNDRPSVNTDDIFSQAQGPIGSFFDEIYKIFTPDSKSKGSDIHEIVRLSLEEIATGITYDASYKRNINCNNCGGWGGLNLSLCSNCNGTGYINFNQNTTLGTIKRRGKCSICFGKGQIPKNPCGICKSSGLVQEVKNLRIKFEAGIEDGRELKIAGMGNFTKASSSAGDLIIKIKEKPHNLFTREGDNIRFAKKISFPSACLRKPIKIKTLVGTSITINISNVDLSKTMRVRGKGIIGGDMLIDFDIHIPKTTNALQRTYLKELNKDSNINPYQDED